MHTNPAPGGSAPRATNRKDMGDMTTHKIDLVRSNDSYTARWRQPRAKMTIQRSPDVAPEVVDGFDATVVLRGAFRHNPHSPFEVVIFEDERAFAHWHGSSHAPEGAIGDLSAQATVISNRREPRREVINVAAGDILDTPLGRFEIRDDWRLHDPYLVRVAGAPSEAKVIREERVGDAVFTLTNKSWAPADGEEWRPHTGRYELAVADHFEPGAGGVNRFTVIGEYVDGSPAIEAWQRAVAVERDRRG